MKKILLFFFISIISTALHAQQDTFSLMQYAGNYSFNKGDVISSASIIYSNGSLNYETSMGSGSLIKKGADTFITEDQKSTVIFVRDSTKKVNGVIIDDVRDVYLEGKKNETAPPSSQTKQSIEMILQKETYQLVVR